MFLSDVLGVWAGSVNREGFYGPTSSYYGTVEQQGRLMLHMHMLLWIAGSLNPEEMRAKILSERIPSGVSRCLPGCKIVILVIFCPAVMQTFLLVASSCARMKAMLIQRRPYLYHLHLCAKYTLIWTRMAWRLNVGNATTLSCGTTTPNL